MRKAPFPYFGGKRDAAPAVWAALGDVPHYVEPFGGTMAVLLNRPHPANRAYYSETVNDASGLLINFWRSIQFSPDATAEAASWPVTEADKIARSCWVLAKERELDLERLMGDPMWHDPVLAGWWAWCVCVTIGGFGTGGPWWPDRDGRLRKWAKGEQRPLPGVTRQMPHLTSNGQGVAMPQIREPGVSREIPHLSSDGQGVNISSTRLPGVSREIPHLSNDGQGVAMPQIREPGVTRGIPHLSDNGRGVNTAATREPGVYEIDWHPMTMPLLREWFGFLSARLRHVRILNGDWKRAMTRGTVITLPVRQGNGPAGVFLDPPYAGTDGLYAHEAGDIAGEVAEWAVRFGGLPEWRIVAAGYADDDVHEIYLRAGWSEVEWFKNGFIKGGYGTGAHRERLYLSPHCVTEEPAEVQASLFDTGDDL